MIRFRIVQCLCDVVERHAILAMAIQPDTPLTDDEALQGVRELIREWIAGRGEPWGLPPTCDPWCALCGALAGDWVYEIGWSKEFTDWDVAQRYLRDMERAQGQTRALLDALDLSFNARVLRGGG